MTTHRKGYMKNYFKREKEKIVKELGGKCNNFVTC